MQPQKQASVTSLKQMAAALLHCQWWIKTEIIVRTKTNTYSTQYYPVKFNIQILLSVIIERY